MIYNSLGRSSFSDTHPSGGGRRRDQGAPWDKHGLQKNGLSLKFLRLNYRDKRSLYNRWRRDKDAQEGRCPASSHHRSPPERRTGQGGPSNDNVSCLSDSTDSVKTPRVVEHFPRQGVRFSASRWLTFRLPDLTTLKRLGTSAARSR